MERHGIDHVLGKNTTDYKATYDPNILAREARVGNREIYGIKEDALPFTGFDTWHAYEVSFLTTNGRPVNGVMKMKVPCTSKYIVESKSFKLYLFSFNMEKLGDTATEAIEEFLKRASKDLAELLEVSVEIGFFNNVTAIMEEDQTSLYDAEQLSDVVDLDAIRFSVFEENPAILMNGNSKNFFIQSDLLRSNCKITHQPDWGSVFIKFKGDNGLAMDSLARYIVSFRGENHFHEEIVECLYTRLMDKYDPKELMVAALYTRRGGIDICPVRANKADLYPTVIGDITLNDIKDYRQ